MQAGGVKSNSFKVYLYQPNVTEPEIRRFGVFVPILTYDIFRNKLVEIFPSLSGKKFCIYWKDEEGDEVEMSSETELSVALKFMTGDVRKFLIRTEGAPTKKRGTAFHPHILCDGCECGIVGFRYKCLQCRDYDLCENCEKSGLHDEHCVLRIPHPFLFNPANLQKMIHSMESSLSREKHRDRKHLHEVPCMDDTSSSYKKHKKWERRESAPDTGDESEEGCHRKHSHSHKKLKRGKCPYSQMMSDVFTYLSPKVPQTWANEAKEGAPEEFSHAKYLRSVGMTLQKFLDPLGVEVDFEVRPNCGQKGDKKEGEKKEEKTEGKKANVEEKRSPPPTSSPSQKEVRFADSTEWTRQKVDEITELFDRQSVNDNNKGSDNDDWVGLEELERTLGDSQYSSSTGAIPKVPQQEEKVSGREKKQPESSPAAPEKQNLYPNLGTNENGRDRIVRRALEEMLSMGFTNENDWLGRLLEVNDGDIDRTLEMLSLRGKNSNSRS